MYKRRVWLWKNCYWKNKAFCFKGSLQYWWFWKKNSLKFIFPDKCPSCGSKTIKEFNSITKKKDAVRRCSSEGYDCEKISIEKLKHFVSKDAFNIDGFGKKIVENFWKLNIIKFPQDIFKLDFTKIEKLDGWGNL